MYKYIDLQAASMNSIKIGHLFYVNDNTLIDITAAFGEGTEPPISKMEEILKPSRTGGIYRSIDSTTLKNIETEEVVVLREQKSEMFYNNV